MRASGVARLNLYMFSQTLGPEWYGYVCNLCQESNTKHRTVIPLFDWVGCSKMFQDIPIKYCFMCTLVWDSTKLTKSWDARIVTWIGFFESNRQSRKCFLSNVVSPEVSELPVAFRINSACSARLLLEACKVDIWKRFPRFQWIGCIQSAQFPWTSSVFNDGSHRVLWSHPLNSHWFTSHKPNASRKSTSMPASMRREIQKAGKESLSYCILIKIFNRQSQLSSCFNGNVWNKMPLNTSKSSHIKNLEPLPHRI